MRFILVVCVLLCAGSLLPAVDTKTWEQNSMEDFDRGTLQHLSLSSDGRLSVAPRLREDRRDFMRVFGSGLVVVA